MYSRWMKVVILLMCLVPLSLLVRKGLVGELGANPIEVITRSTGLWTLTFLMITLAITPVRKLTGITWLIKFRRMTGLFAFFYGTLHLTTYVWLDKFFDASEMLKDIEKRKFITIGFTAFVLMVPLAITSTRKMIQRLGGKRWQMLHRLIYISATAGVVHFVWLVKKDLTQPLIYAAVLTVLLGYRVVVWIAPKVPALPPAQRPRQAETGD